MLNKINSKLQTVILVVSAVVLFFAVNVIANNSFKKYDIDFTEDSIFDLSKGSKNILENIKEPITLRFFYSRSAANGYPILKNYAERIKAILERYVISSNGNINLKIIDPQAFTDDEDLAIAYGIKGIDLNNNTGDKIYLGLAVSNAADDTRAIPFFHPDRQRFVEYEITKTIFDLTRHKRPSIGLISTVEMEPAPFMGIQALGSGPAWLVIEQLRQSFDIVKIDKEKAEIPANIDFLMLVQPQNLNAEMLVAIDQYVLKGGKAVIFADPNKEGGGTGNPADRGFSPEFNLILKAWGVNIPTETIVADRRAARPVQSGSAASGKVDYIAWLNIGKEGLNQEDITTNMLKNINFATAGSIDDLKTPGIKVTPLVMTSKDSMRMPVDSVRSGAPDPNRMLSNFISDNKEYTLAARISGKASTAFPDLANNPGYVTQSKGDINVILIADTDILKDDTWAQVQDIQGYKVVMQNGDNNSFITNIADLLSGSDDLVSLRGRGASTRNFEVVEDLKRTAEEKFLNKEKELKDRLSATENRLSQLKQQAESEAGGNKLAFQSQQQQEIMAFSAQMSEIRKQLRSVQHELKKDVAALGSVIKFINIALVPILISLFATFIFIFRNRRGM